MKYKLSICMMVKDEEIHIRRCLDSFRDLINREDVELIIVDTGSGDNTVEICKEYTDKVYYKKWFDDFSGMRNVTISYATGDWILIIDADEALEENQNFYESVFNIKNLSYYNTISFKMKNFYSLLDKDRFGQFSTLRMFRNKKNFRYDGAVHNQPIFKLPIYNSDIVLEHYGYVVNDKSIMDKKFNRTKTLLEKEINKDSKNLYYNLQLAVTYNMHGDFKESYEQSKKTYEIYRYLSKAEKKQYFYILGTYISSCLKIEKLNEAIKIAEEAIEIRNDYVDAYFNLGFAYQHIGNFHKACINYLEYIDLLSKYNSLDISKDPSIIIYKIDKNSKDVACRFLSDYYIKNEVYNKAINYIDRLEETKEKIYYSVNANIKINNYNQIFNNYNKTSDEKLKIFFINTLINKLMKENIEDFAKVLKYYINEDSFIGEYSKFLIEENIDLKTKYAKNILKIYNEKITPVAFYEVVKFMIRSNGFNINYFTNISRGAIYKLYEIAARNEYHEIYIETINQMKSINIASKIPKILFATRNVLGSLCYEIEKEYKNTGLKSVLENNLDLFSNYMDISIEALIKLYSIDGLTVKYDFINDVEDKFIALIYLYKYNLEKDNIKVALKYYKSAVETNPEMGDFLKIYLEK